jgi:hypothetical protein
MASADSIMASAFAEEFYQYTSVLIFLEPLAFVACIQQNYNFGVTPKGYNV